MFLVVYKAVFLKNTNYKKGFLQKLIQKQNGGLANINSTCLLTVLVSTRTRGATINKNVDYIKGVVCYLNL